MCLRSNQSEITYQNTYYLSACVVILVLFKVDYIAAYGASVKMYFDFFNFGSRNFIEHLIKRLFQNLFLDVILSPQRIIHSV